MKKTFKMMDLDCANCAAKMEAEANKVAGVNKATISFMTQKITVDAEDENFDNIMSEIQKACSKIEPDCVIKI